MNISDDRLAELMDTAGQGATEMEAAVIAAELLARRAGSDKVRDTQMGDVPTDARYFMRTLDEFGACFSMQEWLEFLRCIIAECQRRLDEHEDGP